jgi:hypothetical protein
VLLLVDLTVGLCSKVRCADVEELRNRVDNVDTDGGKQFVDISIYPLSWTVSSNFYVPYRTSLSPDHTCQCSDAGLEAYLPPGTGYSETCLAF